MQSQLPNSMITNGNDFQNLLSMPNIHDAVKVELSVIVFLPAKLYIVIMLTVMCRLIVEMNMVK